MKGFQFASVLAAGLMLASAASADVLLNGLGGDAGFGENVLARNDDGSTGWIDASSVFSGGLDFFGSNYSGFYINNNGNITFGSALGTYTPYALTGATGNPIIAAFFADVDTRGGATAATAGGNSTGTNLAYWDLDPANGRFTMTWDDVGYFGSHIDLLNAFQIVLTAVGTDGDFDIEFRYETINWTTGDASGGAGGMGGTVARAGWNSGNGSDFFELPQSGDQAAILGLEGTSNIGIAGRWLFQVRNGEVVTPVAEPETLAVFGLGLLGLAAVRRRRRA